MKYLITAIISIFLLASLCSCTRTTAPETSSSSETSSLESSSEEDSEDDFEEGSEEDSEEAPEEDSEPSEESSSSQSSNILVHSASQQPSAPQQTVLPSAPLQTSPQQPSSHSVPSSASSQSSQAEISADPGVPAAQQQPFSLTQTERKSREIISQTYDDSPTVIYSKLLEEIITSETDDPEWPEELDVWVQLKDSLEIKQLKDELARLRKFDSVEELEEMGIDTTSNPIEVNDEFLKMEKQWKAKWEPRRQEIYQQIAELRQDYEKQVLSDELSEFYPVDTGKGERFTSADSLYQTSLWLYLTPEEIRYVYQSGVAEALNTSIDAEENPIG